VSATGAARQETGLLRGGCHPRSSRSQRRARWQCMKRPPCSRTRPPQAAAGCGGCRRARAAAAGTPRRAGLGPLRGLPRVGGRARRGGGGRRRRRARLCRRGARGEARWAAAAGGGAARVAGGAGRPGGAAFEGARRGRAGRAPRGRGGTAAAARRARGGGGRAHGAGGAAGRGADRRRRARQWRCRGASASREPSGERPGVAHVRRHHRQPWRSASARWRPPRRGRAAAGSG
jgi:hypothetical protein